MIYASLKAVPRWSKPPTPLLFLVVALAGGALLLAALAAVTARAQTLPLVTTTVLMIAAALVWWHWRRRADATGLDADGSTPETAIGLPDLGRARLFEAPHTSPNYLMKEMVYVVGRRRAEALTRLALGLGFVAPVIALLAVILLKPLWPLLVLAAIAHLLGIAASRWLFFATAEHVVGLYYGRR